MKIKKKLIDPGPLGRCNDICLIGDLNGDGLDEIVIGAKFHDENTNCLEATSEKPNLVMYSGENWERSVVGYGELEAGGFLYDITGNGLPDIIAGEQGNGKNLYWWENTGDHSKPWKRRLITNQFERYHDQTVGDLDGDGEPELLFLSQNKKILAYFDIPKNPRIEPWSESHCHVIATNFVTEGLQIIDIDGSGKNVIIAGHHILRPNNDPTQPWNIQKLLPHLEWARVQVADFNNDGNLDILLAEAEKPNALMLWLEGPDFKKVHKIGDDFYHLHTLELCDLQGKGKIDIVAAEMHLEREDTPKIYLFLNDGNGNFRKEVFDNKTGAHEGKLINDKTSSFPSLVSKPYAPYNEVAIWEIESD